PEAAPVGTGAPVALATRWRFDITWLVSREREYPNDAPSWDEILLWYAASVIALVVAALVTMIAQLLARRVCDRRLPGSGVFWSMTFLLGLLGPGPLSALYDCVLFTWPVALYAAFHATLLACWWAEGHPSRKRARWLARLTFVGLVLVGYGYLEL